MVSIAVDPILDEIANLEQRESGKSNDKTIRSNSDDPSKRGSFVCVVAALSCALSSACIPFCEALTATYVNLCVSLNRSQTRS